MMAMYFSVVSLYVNDVDRSIEFFTQKLGFELRANAPMPMMGDEARWVTVAPRGAQTELVLIKGFGDWSPEKVGRRTGYVLEVDDIFAAHEQFAKNGVRFSTAPSIEFFGGWAEFQDVDGNTFGMHSEAPTTATAPA